MRPETSPAPAAAGPESTEDVRAWVTSGLWGRDDVGPGAPAGAPWAEVRDAKDWRSFLRTGFLSSALQREGAVLVAAEALARRGHARELVELDRSWGRARAVLPPHEASLGEASARVGRVQLERLRPLQDLRWLERYRSAVASGEAHGWHPVVSGLLLAVFSLPLRPGLQHYGRQVAAGLLASTPLAPRLSGPEREALLDEAVATMADAASRLLPAGPLGLA